jgi:hypothetical protein
MLGGGVTCNTGNKPNLLGPIDWASPNHWTDNVCLGSEVSDIIRSALHWQ